MLDKTKNVPCQIKNLWICADDFSQNAPISEGILNLASKQRINAISCMVNRPLWPEVATCLKNKTDFLKIGLHFNLSYGTAISEEWKEHYGAKLPALQTLLFLLFMRRIKTEIILSELLTQWDTFVENVGYVPDFLDGHQHVHQFPNVRQAFIALCLKKNFTGFCRTTTNGIKDFFSSDCFPKPLAMQLLGGRSLQKDLNKYDLKTNSSFFGFYSFNKAINYRTYFRSFLAASRKDGIIMCHPGLPSQDKTDPQYMIRRFEYDYFLSNEYINDLQEFRFG